MGRRGRNRFVDTWHRREVETAIGTMQRIVMPARDGSQRCECFRLVELDVVSGGMHWTEAVELLRVGIPVWSMVSRVPSPAGSSVKRTVE